MKKMTCRELGGACDLEFRAETFEEMMELSKAHGMEMFQTGDALHLEAIQKAMMLMQDPEAMQEWIANRKEEFNALPDV